MMKNDTKKMVKKAVSISLRVGSVLAVVVVAGCLEMALGGLLGVPVALMCESGAEILKETGKLIS